MDTHSPATSQAPMAGLAPPYFDPLALRAELTGLFRRADSTAEARPLVLERLKALVASARRAAEANLGVERDGRRCAAGLSKFQDELIALVHAYVTTHVYRATESSDSERMAIVATGGYGRGLLAPGSDIDLLFLLPYRQTPWGESVVEAMLYMLWDLGFKVGHATRTVDQCIKHAHADMTIRTSLIDARLVLGDQGLFAKLQRDFANSVMTGTARAFTDAKLAERDERHRRSGESRYRVEPNIKDGKGGLRDLHTLHWLARYMTGRSLDKARIDHASATAAAVGAEAEAAIFSAEELATFRRCETFLWTVRCHLHFLTGRADERLSFEVQKAMAERLHYRDRAGLRAVERFMRHYFLIAKDVGELTNVLSAALEIQQLKSAPRLNKLLNPLTWTTRRQVRRRTDFKIENERLDVADQQAFSRDPVNLLRLFVQGQETGTLYHPSALRLIRHSLRLIDDRLRDDREANRLFLEVLTSRTNPEDTLRRMSEAGVLGRFIPEFGSVISMMQFNMYHHFTVDEHLVRTVGQLHAIEAGALATTLPLSTEIVPTIINRRALFVAAFLHDVGKGRPEDHSIAGARVARTLCPRLGLSAAETDLVAWLVEHHLTMSNVAQSRDLSDQKTIHDFAAIVQTLERLKLLLLLTVADIRAVGPTTWNGWKGQLLRQLYYETEPLLSGGHTQATRTERLDEAKAALRARLADWPAGELDDFVERHYPDYWLRTDTQKQVEHARLVRKAAASGDKLATSFTSDSFTAITELAALAPNHPRLLALFAGCCAASGANIIGAQISTTRDGLALDTFLIEREFADEDDEMRRARRITTTIERVLKGEVRLASLLKGRKPTESRIRAFTVPPEVAINNALSDQFTVIEVAGRDRPGLLYELTSALSDLSLDITSAHITTYGEKAVDVFYITDLTHKKILDPARQAAIRTRLEQVLAGAVASAD